MTKKPKPNIYTTGKFQFWVGQMGGTQVVSEKLNCSSMAVFKWMDKQATPSLGFALKIEKLSKGKITPSQLLKDTTNARQKKSTK